MPIQSAAAEWDTRFSHAAEALWQARVARVEREQRLAHATAHSPPYISHPQPPARARDAEPWNAHTRGDRPVPCAAVSHRADGLAVGAATAAASAAADAARALLGPPAMPSAVGDDRLWAARVDSLALMGTPTAATGHSPASAVEL